jgi:hypothetical protein
VNTSGEYKLGLLQGGVQCARCAGQWTKVGGQGTLPLPGRLVQHVKIDDNLHSPQRRLIELRIEHADLDSLIDTMAVQSPIDELVVRRLKKRRLALRDQIVRLETELDPPEPA